MNQRVDNGGYRRESRPTAEDNTQPRFELFLLGDGEKKVTEEADTRKYGHLLRPNSEYLPPLHELLNPWTIPTTDNESSDVLSVHFRLQRTFQPFSCKVTVPTANI